MNFANVMIIIFLTYYTLYFVRLINKRNRQGIKIVNIELDKLRKISLKTLDEQKKFLNLKHPKSSPFKFTWKVIPSFLLNALIFIVIFRVIMYLFYIGNINLKFWQSLLLVMTLPIIINILLQKFNLQKSDIRVFLR